MQPGLGNCSRPKPAEALARSCRPPGGFFGETAFQLTGIKERAFRIVLSNSGAIFRVATVVATVLSRGPRPEAQCSTRH